MPPGAASLLVAAVLCYAAARPAISASSRRLEPRIESLVTGTAHARWPLAAARWRLSSYARFVVLDAQGLDRRAAASRPQENVASARTERQQAASETSGRLPRRHVLSAVGYSRRQQSESTQPTTSAIHDRWVDGSRPERDRYDDDDDDEDSAGDDRKLSKSDRKRLRKLKAQNRAA